MEHELNQKQKNTLLLKGKDNRFCFAKGQIVQTSLLTPEKECNTFLRGSILFNEGCPNLKCQIVDISRVEALAEKALGKLDWLKQS